MNRAATVALVLLLLPAAVTTQAGHVDDPPAPSGTAWWGPTEVGDGHHIRVGVTVQNPIVEEVGTLTVRAQLELAELLSAAGWVHTDGIRPLLKGFEFDRDSVRVVRVTSLEGGQLIAHDPSRDGDDRYVVPSFTLENAVEGDLRQGSLTADPRITVYWQAHDLQPRGSSGDTQHFHVYLDSTSNGDHGPASLTGPDVGAAESVHWAGAGQTFYGLAPPVGSGDPPRVTILGLHDDTTVAVALKEGTTYVDHPTPTVEVGSMDRVQIALGTGETAVRYRLVGDKPFLALGDATGFAPSLEGGYAGRSFVVQTGSIGNDAGLNLIAPHGRPVSVTATSEAGATSVFNLNDPAPSSGTGNPRPYTLSLWANGPSGGCRASAPGGSAALRPNMVYHVEASDDILVHVGNGMPVQQVPSFDGGPDGQEFAFVLRETFYGGSTCRQGLDSRSWWTMSEAPTTVYLDSPERDDRIDPFPGEPEHAVPGGAGYAGPFNRNGGLNDRPLFAHAGGDATLFAGASSGARATVTGPVTSPGGLGASGLGPATVFAYHDETRVDVTVERFVSGRETTTSFLSTGETLAIEDRPGNDLVSSWRITASKPVATYGHGAQPGFLASMPLLGDVTVGDAQFRGALLDIASATRIEPQTQSTTPGEPVTYEFLVTNLGRGHDGDGIQDTAIITVDNPTNWDAELDRSGGGEEAVVPLAAGATERIRLTVTPPDDAPARSVATISVRATSQSNDDVSVTSGTVTNIRRSFDVGIWFDEVGLAQTQERSAPQGEDVAFRIAVKNKGTVTDSIDLALSGLEDAVEDWDAILLDEEGQAVTQLLLDGSEVAYLDLVVTPPADLAEGLLDLRVVATSGSQPSAFDRVTAVAIVRAPADIEATAETLNRFVVPGEEAVFPIHVENTGAGSVKLDLEAAADALEGWGEPGFFILEPSSGQRVAVPSLNVRPGQSVDFLVVISSPETALAGDLATVRALARPPGGAPAFEMAFTAVAAAVHELMVEPSASPLLARTDGEPLSFDVRLDNDGNVDEVLALDASEVPPGWSLVGADAPVTVARGGSTVLNLGLAGPPGAAAQNFNLTLRLRSDDGSVTTKTIPVIVPDQHGIVVETDEVEPAQPGRPARMLVNVTNGGNAPARVFARAADGEPWPVVGTHPVDLPPGATTRILVGWDVPARTPVGTSPHRLDLVLERVGDDARAAVQTVTAEVDVGRPQVRVDESGASSAPGGSLVRAVVANDGDRPAHDVRVRLLAGSVVVDEVVVEVLQSGGRATVSLLDPDQHGRLRLVVDPDDTIVEANESDNHAELSASALDAPGVGVWALLVAALGAAWAARRRD